MAKKVSPDKGKTVASYFEKHADWRGTTMTRLHALVTRAAPDASHSIKWAQPVYESGGPFAYMKANKNHVNFGFWRGTELTDPDGLLEGTGDKMRHLKLSEGAALPEKQVLAWVKEAVQLNAELGNPTKRG